jgi:hypothetical protein
MFAHFKPGIIKKVTKAWSRISIFFNSCGLKHKKISVVRVVLHFINDKYENVTRLISLPELLRHRKSGVNKL